MAEESMQAAIQYLDFDIQISPGDGLRYPVSVRSIGGDAHEQMILDFKSNDLDRYLDKLQIALLRSSKKHRQLSQEELVVREFGQKLFNALFSQSIRRCYDASWALAQAQGKGLRIRLNIQADELSALPWEFLFDPVKDDFLCLSKKTPVVRYLDCPGQIQPMEITPPLQVLGMVSNPVGLDELDVEVEKSNLEEALAPLVGRGLAQLTWLENGTWRALFNALSVGQWHIFHFVGHANYDEGAGEGVLAFEGEGKRPKLFSAGQVARLLGQHDSLRLVVLNACESGHTGQGGLYSSTAAKLVKNGLPAVIAMQYDISDPAAIELSLSFYTFLAANWPVDAALTWARVALGFAITNTLEWGTPVLFMRTEDGVLFRIKAPQAAAGATPAEVKSSEAGTIPQKAKPASTPPAKPVIVSEGGKELLIPLAAEVKMSLVPIPAGNFLMGSDARKDKDAFDNERPQHTVYLPDYYLGKTPVTVAQFAVFVKARNHQTIAERDGSGWVWDFRKREFNKVKGADWLHPHGPGSNIESKARHPVTQVSWLDAVAFCQWLSEFSQLEVRLPSEAEWEKAARGTEGYIYPWGNEPPDGSRCNFDLNEGDTTPVGNYSPLGDSPYGCQDMAGNVWEWTHSLHKQYPYVAGDSRESESASEPRVLRGGSFFIDRRFVRCAFRSRNLPDLRYYDLGFRVLVSPIHL